MLVLLAACARQVPPTQPRLPPIPSGQACLTALAQLGVPPCPGVPGSRSCPVDTPVLEPGPAPRLSPPLHTSCSLLFVWAGFEPEIDRLARRTLGAGLQRVQHYG